jgi:hypothetical protein
VVALLGPMPPHCTRSFLRQESHNVVVPVFLTRNEKDDTIPINNVHVFIKLTMNQKDEAS